MTKTMRASRVSALGKVVCEETPVKPPGEGELLVRTRMAAICGSDLHKVFLGDELIPHACPHGYPGHEGIGQVEQTNHPDFAVGDLVLTVPGPPDMFAFADYQTIPARYCLKVPGSLPLEQLLMAQQLGTCIFSLRQRPVDVVGKTVLVVGQGSAGMFFSKLLKRAGAAQVIASDYSEHRLDYGRRMGGVDVAVTAQGDNVMQAVKDLTGGRGADYVIEAVGSAQTQLEAVSQAAFDGEILYFGLPDTTDPIPFDYANFFRKRLGASTTYGCQFEPGLVSFQMAVDMIVRGEINVEGLVSSVFPMEQIGEAVRLAHDEVNATLKVAVDLEA